MIGAVAGAWADMRMVAAGVRALGVDGAQSGFAIEIEAVTVSQAGQREDPVLLVEMLDDAGFAQTLGHVLGWLVTLKGIDHFQTDQVIDPYFNR